MTLREKLLKELKSWIDFRQGEVGDCPEMDELLDKIVEILKGENRT